MTMAQEDVPCPEHGVDAELPAKLTKPAPAGLTIDLIGDNVENICGMDDMPEVTGGISTCRM